MAKTTRDDIEKMMEIGVFVPTKTLLWFGEVELEFATNAIKGLVALDLVRPTEPINILLNSSGGDVTQGMGIYNQIRKCKSPVHIAVVGEAESVAAWILQAADHRLAYRDSTIMIHVGTDSFNEDHPENIKARMKHSEALELRMEQIIADRMGLSILAAHDLMEFDQLYTAHEARTAGLIDEVVE